MNQVIKYHITGKELRRRLKIRSFDEYYNSRLLRWAGHVARMDKTRMPRMLLTGWVEAPRPVGAPQMTIGRTIKKALSSFKLPTEFPEWRKLAQERSTWRSSTHPDTAARHN
jgi:hypothetical protein